MKVKYNIDTMLEAIERVTALISADAEGNQILTFKDIIDELEFQYNELIDLEIFKLSIKRIK